ncbi:hypothetical protein ACH4MG_34925 [Streptomyces sp. NPDC017454]|uniref:hypothetical protein n=1 Tax=Streptomyces sp. NPDC017454 TaxID=3364997 RepID=UPI00378E9B78
MNPQKRTRRAPVRREVGQDEPKKATRRRRKGVAPDPEEPKEPRERTRRKTLPPGTKATPAWKVGVGNPPCSEQDDD